MNQVNTFDPSDRIDIDVNTEDNSSTIGNRIYNSIKNDIFILLIKEQIWETYKLKRESTTAASLPLSSSSLSSLMIKNILEESGLREMLINTAMKIYERNTALKMYRNPFDKTLANARKAYDESIDYIREARIVWETGINEELLNVMSEMKRPFTIIRTAGTPNHHLEPNSNTNTNADTIRFLYDSEDIFETCIAINCPYMKLAYLEKYLGLMKVGLQTPGLSELIARYPELGPSYTQLGLDENNSIWGNKFSYARHDEGEAICSHGNALDARIYMRRGVPPSLRNKIWRLALGFTDDNIKTEKATLDHLLNECHRLDLLTDELFIHDIQNIIDDPRFFVFEEELKEVILSFTRDDYVWKNAEYQIHAPLIGHSATGEDTPSPPSGVQPFLGLASYFAPLCYIYKDKGALYSVSRALYIKIWCKMNVLSSDAGTLLHVCQTFESLLVAANPKLFLHLINIGIQPLQIALPWLQLGFVTILETDQILMLWDRVLGYMDTTILAVLAAAILCSRSEPLLMSATASDATSIILENSRQKVIPLLQMFLFSENN